MSRNLNLVCYATVVKFDEYLERNGDADVMMDMNEFMKVVSFYCYFFAIYTVTVLKVGRVRVPWGVFQWDGSGTSSNT